MAWLVLETPQGDQLHALGTATTVGRTRECQIRLGDLMVSKLHCTIHQRGGEFWLQDLDSLNCTMVGGVVVRGEVRLKHEDRIEIGSTRLRFVQPPAGDQAVVAPAPLATPTLPAIILRGPDHAPRIVVHPPRATRHEARPAEPRADRTIARDPEARSPIENGLLVVGRTGDVRVRLWNVRIDRGGFFLRVPLAGDRPPSSRLHHYVGKSRHEEMVLEEGDAAFDDLVAQAARDGGSLPEPERVRFVSELVYRTLGGILTRERRAACDALCEAYAGRAMRIGEIIRLGAGVCRHRAFLFFHLARRLGLGVELYRGAVPGGRHAWNVVRVGGTRVFVDTTENVVLDDAREAEQAWGFQASRHDLLHIDHTMDPGRIVRAGDDEGRIEIPRFRHELRKVPGDEEAVLLLYPEEDLPEVRFLHVHFHAGRPTASMFAMDPFVSARIFSIVGDEAHHLTDAIDRDLLARMRDAWENGPPRA
jgi:hypothetical protein